LLNLKSNLVYQNDEEPEDPMDMEELDAVESDEEKMEVIDDNLSQQVTSFSNGQLY